MPFPSAGMAFRGARAALLAVVVLAIVTSDVQAQVSVTTANGGFNLPGSYSGYVTISGLNFGTASTPTAAFRSASSTNCPSTSWTSGTTVQCQLASSKALYDYYRYDGSEALQNSLVVRSAGSDGSMGFTFDAPTLSHTIDELPNAPTSGGTSLTIRGDNFWMVNSSPTAYLGATFCSSTRWISDTSILCAVNSLTNARPPTIDNSEGPRLSVRVRAVVGTRASAIGFSFDAPTITYGYPHSNLAMSGGVSLTLNGFNFGSQYASATVTLHGDTHGSGLSCSSHTWISETAMRCQPNLNLPLASGSPVIVTVGAVVGTRALGFSYNAPVMSLAYAGTQLSQNLPPSGGTTITIVGLNFGSPNFTPSAALGEGGIDGHDLCSTTTWSTNTQILCLAGASTPAGLKTAALLTVAATVGTRQKLLSFDAPTISSLALVNQPFSSALSVTISGLNFGYKSTTPTFFFIGSTSCTTTSWSSSTTVSCAGAAYASTYVQPLHRFEVASVFGTSAELFTFDAPVVSAHLPRNVPLSGKGTVTISGLQFAAVDPSASARIKDQVCGSTQWASATTILCESPSKSNSGGTTVSVSVTISAVVGTRDILGHLTFDAPVVSSHYRYNTAQTGGGYVTLYGSNFGNENFTPSASNPGASSYMCGTTAWTTYSVVTCSPSTNLGHYSVPSKAFTAVTVSAVVGTRQLGFTYDAPVLSHLGPANNPHSGAGTVTISGLNFGAGGFTPTAQVDLDVCATTAWTSSSSVECSVSSMMDLKNAAGVQPGNLLLTVSAVIGTRRTAFTFDSPSFSGSVGPNIVTSGGASVTISGLNFGALYSQTPTAFLADSIQGTTSWSSATTVSFQTGEISAYKWNRAGFGATIGSSIGTAVGVFSFDTPAISAANAFNIITSGSASVTIWGVNFGVEFSSSPTAQVGTTLCTSTTWVSATQLVCGISAGLGPKKTISVTISAVVGTKALGFSFDAPVISHSAPYNQATSSQQLVSIFGMNFGTVNASPTGIFIGSGVTVCESTFWVSDTIITCRGVQGTGAKTNYAVTVAAVVGTRSGYMFTYDAPVLTHNNPVNTANSAHGIITLYGMDFGKTNATPSAIISDISDICPTTSWTTDSIVQCGSSVATELAGMPGRVRTVLTVSSLVGTARYLFSFDSPVLSFSPSNFGSSSGHSVTISGLNFGSKYSPTPTLAIVADACGTTAWTSATTTSCYAAGSVTAATGLFTNKALKITVNSIVSTQMNVFTFDAPVVSFWMDVANSAVSGGARVSLLGFNFANYDLSPSVRIQSTSCATVSWATSTIVSCVSPSGGNAVDIPYLQVKMTVGAIVGTSSGPKFTFDAPVLSYEGATNLVLGSSGYTLTMAGFNFGYAGTTPTTVVISGASVYPCSTSSWTSVTAIRCRAPMNVPGGKKSSAVTVSAVVGTRVHRFSYDAPVVSFLDNSNAVHSTGTTVTIKGLNFGGDDLTQTAAMDTYPDGSLFCETSSWSSYSAVKCLAGAINQPPGAGRHSVLTVGAVVGTRLNAFSFDSPAVTSNTVDNTPPCASTTITISGLNFGGLYNQTPTAGLEDAACSTTTWSSVSTVQCTASIGGVNIKSKLTVAAAVGTSAVTFSFDTPVISFQLGKPNAAASGGTSVTISGLNFGAMYSSTPSIRLGQSNCLTSAWSSATTVSCQSPGGVGMSVSHIVTVESASGTLTGAFTFDSPVVSFFAATNAAVSLGNSLTVVGLNFLSFDYTPSGQVGATFCQSTSWQSVTSMLCSPPIGSGSGHGMFVTISAIVGTAKSHFSFDAPVISQLDTTNLVMTSGQYLTLNGLNFGPSDVSPTLVLTTSTMCASSVWVTDTQVVCHNTGLPAAGVSVKMSAAVTVSAVVGTRIQGFSYDAPVMSSVRTFNAVASAGSSVTLFGMNFGKDSLTPTAMIGEQDCLTTSWTTYSVVKCGTPTLAYTALKRQASLTVSTIVGTRTGAFTFDAPSTTSFVGQSAMSGGTFVTISGLNFAAVSLTPTLSVGDETKACQTTSWSSGTTVQCGQTNGRGGYDQNLIATVASLVSTAARLFTFDSPVVSHLLDDNAPFSGSSSVTITGMNFHSSNLTPSARLDHTSCGTVSWITNSHLYCHTAAGSGSNLNVPVTIHALIGSAYPKLLTFDAPTASYMTAYNVPVSGGLSVTIKGLNFGFSDDATPTVRLGHTLCQTTSYVSHTSLTCLASTGSGASSTIAVTISAVVGTRNRGFSFDSPVTSQLERANMPTTGAGSVTLYGFNFDYSNITPTATIDQAQCACTSWATTTSLKCSVSSGYGSKIATVLTVSTAVGTRLGVFSYDTPVVSDGSRSNAAGSSGVTVTISGLNFAGSISTTPTARLDSSETLCATTSWSSSTTVACYFTAMTHGKAVRLMLTVASTVGTGARLFSFDSPVVSYHLATNAPSSGGSVTITGLNFGAGTVSPTVRLGQSVCQTSSWTAYTSLLCGSQGGTGAQLTTRITVSAAVGTLVQAFTFDAPLISQLVNPNAATSDSISLTLRGVNFYTSQPSATAKVGLSRCLSTAWLSSSSLRCAIMPGVGIVSSVVTISAVVGTRLNTFTYDSPVLTASQADNHAVTGGAIVSLQGFNFGMEDATPSSTLGSLDCASTSWATTTTVHCLTTNTNHAGVSIKLATIMTVAALVGTRQRMFTYDAPVITDMKPRNMVHSSGGTVTISGLNFGYVALSATASLSDEDAMCATTGWSSATTVQCNPAASSAVAVVGKLTVASVVGTSVAMFSFDAPTISFSLGQANGAVSAGTTVTISGLNFGVKDRTPTIRIAATSCTFTQWSSATTLQCGAPANNGQGLRITAQVYSRIGTITTHFTFDSPVVSGVTHENGASSGGTSITLAGLGFGPSALSSTVKLGATLCGCNAWVSTTSMVCHQTVYGAGKASLFVTISAVVGTRAAGTFSFDAPTISYHENFNVPRSGQGVVSFFGLNFGAEEFTPTASFSSGGADGQLLCGTSSWTSVSTVLCLTQDEVVAGLAPAAAARVATVTVSAVVGTRNLKTFTYDSPIISYDIPSNIATSGGSTLTLFGLNFAAISTPTAAIGENECATTSWSAGTLVLCQAGSGASAAVDMLITVNTLVGTRHGIFTFDAPVMSHASPLNGPVSSGVSVTISGLNFGSKSYSASAKVGQTSCSTTSWSSATTLQCAPGLTVGVEMPIIADISSLVGTSARFFSFDAPVLTHVSPQNLPATASSYLSIFGVNFVSDDKSVTAAVASNVCASTSWSSDSTIRCVVSSASGDSIPATVTVNAIVGTVKGSFSFDAPVISSLNLANAPASAGNLLTLLGNNFGSIDPSPTAILGSSMCSSAPWTSDTTIICVGSSGHGTKTTVTVTVSAVVGTRVQRFSYDAPVVTHATLENFPHSGGAFVSLYGINFAQTNLTPTAVFEEYLCQTTAWSTATSLLCGSAIGPASRTGLNINTVLTVSSQVSTKVGGFTFDSPAVSAGSVPNSPASSLLSVTISGLNFGSTSATPTLAISATTCSTTAWTSGTTVSCSSADKTGFGVGHRLSITLSHLTGTGLSLFSFDAPALSGLHADNAVVTGSSYLTLNGVNFAVGVNYTPSVAIASAGCSTSSWSTNTRVTCLSIPGSPSGGSNHLKLTVNAIVGTSAAMFSFDAPVISTLFEDNGPTSGGVSLTIFGSNFGSIDSTPTTRLGSSLCASQIWVSDSSIVCAAASGAGKMQAAVVTVAAVVGTRVSALSFDAPVISTGSPSNGAMSGSFDLTMHGLNFGSSNPTPSAAVSDASCATTVWTDDTQVACLSESTGYSAKASVALTVSAVVGTKKNVFSYDAPVMSYFTLVGNAPASGGATFTLSGVNFAGKDLTPTTHIGTTTCGSVSWQTSTAVLCSQSPAGYGQKVRAVFTVGSSVGTFLRGFTFDGPVITDVTSNAVGTGHTVISLNGLNFALPDTTVTAALGSSQCSTASWTTGTKIVCSTPSGANAVSLVAVSLATIVGTGRSLFTFDAPVLSFLNAANAPAYVVTAADLTVSGVNFGPDDLSPTARLGISLCVSTKWSSDTSISCTVPAGSGQPMPMGITISAVVGTKMGAYTFDGPVVTVFEPSNLANSGGVSLSISGLNFSPSDISSTVAVGARVCVTASWVTNSHVLCQTTAEQYGSNTAVLTVSTVVGTRSSGFTFDAPVFSAFQVANIPSTGGSTVTLKGLNFAYNDVTSTIRVNSMSCSTASWMSSTSALCLSSSGVGMSKSIAFTISGLIGQVSTSLSRFTYDAPTVSFANPNGAASGGQSFTVTGFNFGTSSYTPTFIVGDTACLTSSWSTFSSVKCASAVGMGTSDIIAIISSMVGTTSSAFTYDSPVVTFISATNAPAMDIATRRSSVSVFGFNFGSSDRSGTARLGSTICLTTIWSSDTAISCTTPPGTGLKTSLSITLAAVVGTQTGQFSFDSPVLTLVNTANVASTGAGDVTLMGFNFAPEDFTPTARLGHSLCGTTAWSTGTSLVCVTASGHGLGHNAALTVVSLLGTLRNVFSYNAPVLSMVSPGNSPATGGVSVTIYGFSMGFEDISPSVRISSTLCGTSAWNSNTRVTCTSGVGIGMREAVALTISAAVGTLLDVYSYDAPACSYSHAFNMPTTGHTSLTLKGINFGMRNFTPSVTIGGSLCRTSQWTSDTAVKCQTAYGSGTRLSGDVLVQGQVGTVFNIFTFGAPVATHLHPTNVPLSVGTSVTVWGLNFGAIEVTPTIRLGPVDCQTTSWNSATSLSCDPADGYGRALSLGVTIATLVGTQATVFSFDAPVASSVAAFNAATTAGTSVTMSGLNFAADDVTPTVLLGMTMCSTASWSSMTTVQCMSSYGSGMIANTPITIASLVGTYLQFFTYDTPIMSRLTHPNSPVTGSASVTLLGANFGWTSVSPTARLGDTACTSTSWNSGTSVTCIKTAFGAGLRHRGVVTLSGLLGTREDLFSYDSPVMTHVSPANEATSASLSLTISGVNLGYGVDVTPSMQIGLTACTTTAWSTTTTVTCKSTYGTGLARSLIAQVAKNIGTAGGVFSYDAPALSSQGTNAPASAGISVTITGLNFAFIDLSGTANVGSTPCATSTWNSATSLGCYVEDGFGSAIPIVATIDGLIGTRFGVFSFDSPVVSFVRAQNSVSSGGTIVTFSGKNFGFSDSTPTSVIGSSSCLTSIWTTDTSVQCATPAGSSKQFRALLTIDSVPGTLTHVFTYDAPIATLAAASNGPNTGGTSVSVFGLNFAGSNPTPSVVVQMVSQCTSVGWLSFTTLTCGMPTGYGSVNVALTVMAQVHTFKNAFTFDAPAMSVFSGSNMALTTQGSITVTGYNFVTVDRTPTVHIGATACGTTAWTTNTAVTCLVSGRGLGAAHNVRHAHADAVAAVDMAFTYDAPAVTQTAYLTAPIAGGISVTMNGFNFGMLDLTVTTQLGFTHCGTSSWTSSTTVLCISAQGAGQALSTTMTLASLIGTHKIAYTYAAPEVTNLLGINGATSGSGLLTVNGQNFGLSDTTPTTQIGSTICATSRWTSTTAIQCETSTGTGAALTAAVTVARQVGSRVSSFSYDGPIITSTMRSNGPASGAASVTVLGSNFGMEDFTPSLVIGSTMCVTTVWSSDSAMTCALTAGTGAEQTLNSIVTGVIGTFSVQFSYDSPVVTASFAKNSPFAGGAVITMNGVNMGVSDLNAVGRLGLTACAATTYLSDTALACTVASGYGKAHAATVQILPSLSGTAVAVFTYDSPVVTYAYVYNMAQNAMHTTTISGMNFGTTDTKPNFYVGGTNCLQTQWVSSTSATCRPMGGVGVTLAVVANVNTMIGTLASIFTYDSPVVTHMTTVNGPATAGNTVTLVGKNFGTYSGHNAATRIHSALCSENTWISYTSILCAGSASGTGVAKTVAITAGGAIGTFFAAFTYDAPVALVLRTPNAPVTGGGVLTLVGSNFGSYSLTPSVIVGATDCATTVWTSFSTLECRLQGGIGKDLIRITTVIDNVAGTQQSMFTYDAPILTDLQGNSPTSGGAAVTVFGMNFGVTDPNPTVKLNNVDCSASVWASSSSVTCTAPIGSGIALPIAADAVTLVGTRLSAMTYDAPVVTHIAGAANAPTSGGAVFTLHGSNFGVTASVDNTNPTNQIADNFGNAIGPSSAYNPMTKGIATKWCASVGWTSDTEITCSYSAQGGGANQDIGATADRNSGYLERAWTFDAPVLTGILQPNGPASGGAAVSIVGMNFGWKYTDSQGQIFASSEKPAAIVSASSDQTCETTTWLSDSSVACITPPGIATVKSVSVDTGCRFTSCADISRQAINAGSMTAAFTYDGPVVTFLALNNGPTIGGAELTFYGVNFGTTMPSLVGARIGTTSCVSTSWQTNTAVTCTTPVGKARGSQALPVSITVGMANGVGTALKAFRYDASLSFPVSSMDEEAIQSLQDYLSLSSSEANSVTVTSQANSVTDQGMETLDIRNGDLRSFNNPSNPGPEIFSMVGGRRRQTTSPFTLPPTTTTYYYQVGDLVNITFSAYAEDSSTNVAIATWAGRTAPSFTGYEYQMVSRPQGRKASGYFTWSPAAASPKDGYALCAQLIDSQTVVQDYMCVRIVVLSCQHVVQPGETLESVANMYKVSSRTIWWLNADLQKRYSQPSNGALTTALQAGKIIYIGRTYTIRAGESLTTIVKDLESSWYWVNKHNPRKIFFPATVSMDSMSYKTRQDFVGQEYCVVADISPVLHRELN